MSSNSTIRALLALLVGFGLVFGGYKLFVESGGQGVGPDLGTTNGGTSANGGSTSTGQKNGSQNGPKNGESGSKTGDRKVGTGGDPLPGVVDRAVLRFVDAESRAPLSGVRLFDQRRDIDLGVSDVDGLLELRGVSPAFLVAWGDGFFATPISQDAQEALRETGHCDVRVWVDRYTLRRELQSRAVEGVEIPAEAALLFTVVDGGRETEEFPIARVGEGRALAPELRAAWRVHSMQTMGLPSRHVMYRIGPRPLPWRGKIEKLALRFSQARRYLVRAYTDDGRVATATVAVAPRDAGPISLEWQRGRELAVTVVDEVKKPIPAAVVRLRNVTVPDEVLHQSRTNSSGSVSFRGLFARDQVEVQVEARGYRAKSMRITIGEPELRVRLAAVETKAHRIRVREIRSERLLAGVRAWVGDPSVESVQAQSDETGVIDLRLTQDDTGSVFTLRCEGYLDHREVLSSASGLPLPPVVHLVPADRERQLTLKLVAKVDGSVSPERGRGWNVRLSPARDSNGVLRPGAMADGLFTRVQPARKGRMILNGYRVDARLEAAVDENGKFVLWASSGGRATLQALVKGGPQKDVFLVLGKAQTVELR